MDERLGGFRERGTLMPEPRKLPRVFVVDDEHVIATSLAIILRQLGFEAKSFTEPLDAFSAANLEAPDLLISDVVMPVMSGIDLAIQMQERCPNCKVLLFSGQAATAGMLEQARANGHNFELLLKPVHPKDLLREIQKVTGDSQSLS
jgi:DNA-binding NtrC family response regulator